VARKASAVIGPSPGLDRQHGLDDLQQLGLVSEQLADVAREPGATDAPDPDPEAAQCPADLGLDVDQLVHEQAALGQQQAPLLGLPRLDAHGAEPSRAHELGNSARIAAVGLDRHRPNRRLGVACLDADRRQA